jgi:hypothetical protein
MAQTKGDTLVLQVGGWVWGQQPDPTKKKGVVTILHSKPWNAMNT